jgi:nucleotide-binding universal stress UspA family protein
MKFQHIVVATDLTDCSLPALTAALDLAELAAAQVTLVFALEPTQALPGLEAFALEGLPVDWSGRILAAQQHQAEQQLAELAVTHRRWRAGIETALLTGPLPETLTDYLKQSGADLLVVGSHGRRGAAHFFLGSIAERLLRQAPCPVLVVKPPAAA